MFLGRSLLRPTSLRQVSRSGLLRHGQREALRHGCRALSVDIRTQELLQNLATQADTLKTTKDLSTIHAVYPTFVEGLRKARLKSHTDTPLVEEDVRNILGALAASGRPQDLQRIDELLHDLESVFGIQPTPEIYTTIVESFAQKAHPRIGLNFLAKMPILPGSFIPIVDHFIAVLEPAIEKAPFSFVRDAVANMHRLGCRPNADIANIVIRALWRANEVDGQKPTLETFAPIFDLIESWKISYSSSTANLIASLFDGAGLGASGQKTRSVYEQRFKDTNGSDPWASKLTHAAVTSGIKAACDLFNQSSGNKHEKARSQALRHVLRGSSTLSDIELASKELETPLDVRHWTNVISNACRRNNIPEALRIYEASRSSLFHIDAGLVAPIIRTLWRKASQQRASDEFIDQALALYHDLIASYPPDSTTQQEPGKGFRSTRGPDADIFHTLFRLLSRNQHPDKYFPIAIQLVKDMQAYKFSTRVSPVAASLICLGMQQCDTSDSALDVYRRYQEFLDEDGYGIVLQFFCKKEFGPHYAPAIQDYFGIVRDMQRAGIEVTPKVYTILLTQIGYLAAKLTGDVSDQRFADELLSITRRTHDILSLDTSFAPDQVLMSQLLNTYQRLGYLGDAYRVWELMYLTGNYNPVTVSNILDGCGHAGDLHTARAIWTKLFRDGFSFDLNNWNAWVECLCRCGQLDMARKVVLDDMPRAGKKPTVETVSILLGFARGQKVEREVLAQIQVNFPSLYPRVVAAASNGSSSSKSKSID
ncbi:hypothetical protein FA13DRAFT_415226 [Coprinellus micaceus]|uniref:Uncharacterized protein n=1 Tax=Coprinellus micaceus TaxID=71717 RepID=A0A4Y7TZ83_COPMI|nr:hypothetical protein FA13DRAFT_415226 [Coprinellus micaceus]